jgi:hypothetical protein
LAVTETNTFAPDIAEMAEEAYERAGLKLSSAYDLRTARRSIDFMLLGWQNRGVNLWTVEEQITSDLVKGTSKYTLKEDTIAVFEVLLRQYSGDVSKQTDFELGRISRDVYGGITNKLVEGRPTQVFVDRQQNPDTGVTATLWPVPDKNTTYKLVYYRMRAMYDSGPGGTYNPDVPNRFWPAFVAGLAYNVALKRPDATDRLQILKQSYEEEFQLAADEDREKAPLRFFPGGYR